MRDLLLTLIVIAYVVTMFAVATLTTELCRQEFGGIWSTIYLDDCTGSYWAPTTFGHPTEREGTQRNVFEQGDP